MRIVFFGTPDWAVPSLESLAATSHTLALVVTQPAKRRGRRGGASPSPVAAASAALDLPVIEPTSVRSAELLARLGSLEPDLFIVVAYGKIFPASLLAIPRLGPVNLHFSMLPRHRGAAPVQWTLVEGEPVTGVTTMRMIEKLDAGPIYLQEELAIEPGEHAPSLGARLAVRGAGLLLRTVEGLALDKLAPREQEDREATYAPMLKAEDGRIDWSQRSETIVRRVRGFDPWPGQSALSSRGRVRILRARAGTGTGTGTEEAGGPEPGTVLGAAGDAVRIACAGGTVLEALTVQPEGRRPMSGAEALHGRHVSPGERLMPIP